MARSLLLSIIGNETSAVRALRNVGSEADRTADDIEALGRVTVGADGRLRDARGRFVAAGDAARQMGSDAERGGRGFSMLGDILGRLTPSLSGLVGGLGGVAGQVGILAAAVGSAVPLIGGLASALVAIAPAAAVAATGLAAIGLAGGALKIGMSGVGDALSAALNPGDPAAYAAALKELTPAAASFVAEVHKLQPAFASIKEAVQESLFQGLDKSFTQAASTTLPTFRQGLVGAAEALNGMGKGLLDTMTALGKTGTLDRLFSGAADGLANLTKVPGQLLQGFTQVGAAAAPLFERMTQRLGEGATSIADRLSRAFSSGAMSSAIETAVGLLGQLGQVAGNVFKIVSSVFGAAQTSGGGFIGVLQTITAEIAKVASSSGVQSGLGAIFTTIGTLAKTVGPLIGEALSQLGPVFAALGPPVQTLIQALGAGLQPIIQALGPVLTAAAQAVGQLVTSFAPLLPVLGQLIAGILPVLTPFLNVIAQAFAQLAPLVQQVAGLLSAELAPILSQLPAMVQPFADTFSQLVATALPVAMELFQALTPAISTVVQAIGQLATALAPAMAAFQQASVAIVGAIMPAVRMLIPIIGQLAGIFANQLARLITGVVVPALNALTALLRGDFKGAWDTAKTALVAAVKLMIDNVVGLPVKIINALMPLIAGLGRVIVQAGAAFINGLNQWMLRALIALGRLPGQILSRLSKLGSLLVGAGADLVRGLINGMASMVGPLLSRARDLATGAVNAIKGALDINSPSKKTIPLGEGIDEGLAVGIIRGIPLVKDAIHNVAGAAISEIHEATHNPKVLTEMARSIIDVSGFAKEFEKAIDKGADAISDVIRKLREKVRDAFKSGAISKDDRDAFLDVLTAGNKELGRLANEREKILDRIKLLQDTAKKITEQTLNFASIMNIKGDDGASPTGGQLVAGLQARLATIRTFAGNIKKLAQAGLSRAILQQILNAGIEGGSAIAAELANGPSSIIAALNTTQTQINEVAKNLGIDGADALFGSGKAMGDAFLKGLQAMEESLVNTMETIIKMILEILTDGINDAKGKLKELTDIPMPDWKAPPIPGPPSPDAPKPTPLKYTPSPAPRKAPTFAGSSLAAAGGGKTVNIKMEKVEVNNMTDIDAVANRLSFAARSVAL